MESDMSLQTSGPASPPVRLRRRPDLRLIFAATFALALLAASTVVSASAVLMLPRVWEFLLLQPDELSGTLSGPDLPLLESPAATVYGTEAATSVEASDEVSVPSGRAEPSGPHYVLRPEDYADGWGQAAGDAGGAAIARSHQIVVASEGILRGRMILRGAEQATASELEGLRVLVLRRGVLAGTARLDENAAFEIHGLKTGTHAVVVGDDQILLAFAVHILREGTQEEADVEIVEFPLCSPLVGGEETAGALRRLARLGTADRVPSDEIEPEESLIPRSVRPVRQQGVPGTPIVSHVVRQQANGDVIGRVRRLHSESGRHLRPPATEVALLQDQQVMAVAQTDEQGFFRLPHVEPGMYALVAATVPKEGQIVQQREEPATDEQPVSLLDERRAFRGYAAFAVKVAPFTPPRQERIQAAAEVTMEGETPLALDLALADIIDLVASAHLPSIGSRRERSGRAFTGGLPPASGRSPVIANPGQVPIIPPPPPGRGGGLSTIGITPPSRRDRVMSPARL
jgi:hypothetical protein